MIPHVLGPIQDMPFFELSTIQCCRNGLAGFVARHRFAAILSQQAGHQGCAGQPRLQATGGETHRSSEMGIFHGFGSQHGPGDEGIGLIEAFLALVPITAIGSVQEHVAPEGGIARKEFVGAFACEHHLVIDMPHVAAHQIFGHPKRVVDRALGVPEGGLEMVVEVIA